MADPNLAQLMQLPGAVNPGNPIPAANPVQQQPQQDPLQQSILNAAQLGQGTFESQLSRMHALSNKINLLQQAQTEAAQNAPKPWAPSYQPMTGQGFGGDVKNILGNVGRGILQGLSYTPEGRKIETSQYARAMQPYQVQQQTRAQQIQELQQQMGQEEKPLEAAANLQYKPFMAGAAQEKAQAAMLSAQSKSAYDKAMIPIKQRAQDIQLQVSQGKLSAENARTQVEALVGEGRNAVLQQVGMANVGQKESQTQIDAAMKQFTDEIEHPLQSLLGFAPQSPLGTQTPTQQAQPANPTNPKGNPPKKTQQGNAGQASGKRHIDFTK